MAMNLASPRRGRRRAPMAEINVTPLVDVMLVLLIIFMVTAPLLTAAVPVDLPDSRANPADSAPEAVTISIDRQGAVFIGDVPVAARALPGTLGALASRGETPEITLRADRALDYGRVMAVMGELNRAGLNRVSLVTSGSADGP
ncbi:ExbD/TolR family protein [Qipengyuania sediminis]|uniref:ExbD/TolR family protein n=1 Tax=Qipengyuania sediminis TaxID=1532023 RepID=UPI001059C214|nr:biopolymer transporter ExbD [Qipengyuania sediminis]